MKNEYSSEKENSSVNVIDEIITSGVKKEILHLSTKNKKLIGNHLLLKLNEQEKQVINFGSCSYLGLEFDERLIQSSKEAMENYGTQFSSSRAYISLGQYEELELLFNKIFEAYTVIVPTTSLAHIAAIPILVNNYDAVILDHQVHNSVHTAVNLIKTRGVYTELVRHNRMDILEDRIKILKQKYNRIWYMADGIYSMYGDATPVNEVLGLMKKYSQLNYYIDDAHGMSCFGKHGRGFVLDKINIQERMVVITSLAKAFATGGSVMVFNNPELARRVRTCGGPLITSGPLQPAILGAAIASAKIHLTDEIYNLQNTLQENIKYTNAMLKKYRLPLISDSNSPIFFIGISLPKLGYGLVQRMLNEGFYLNLGIFPAVPIKNTGIRFTITKLHTFDQINNMINVLDYHFNDILKKEKFPVSNIYQAFKILLPLELKAAEIHGSDKKQENLNIIHTNSITEIEKAEWDNLLGEKGAFNWEGIKLMEESFKNNAAPEHNWEFDYIIIKDNLNNVILATFLTTSLWKDDMLSLNSVSWQIEKKRSVGDPYYLTSKVLAMGSGLTAGSHLYINHSSSFYYEALSMLLDKIYQLQEKYQATTIVLRDFDPTDEKINSFFAGNGFFKIAMPDNNIVQELPWNNTVEFLATLTKRSKRHVKQDALRHENKYEQELIKNAAKKEIEHWYQLYMNVKERSLDLNTFTLPYKLFENISTNNNWEVITLKLKPEFDTRDERKPVAVMFNYVTKQNYNFMIVGIDYKFQTEYKCYNQAIYQVINRAKALGKSKVNLGYTASTEKHKFGSEPIATVGYMQTRDNFSLEVILSMNAMESKA